jgi:hypothetical protein
MRHSFTQMHMHRIVDVNIMSAQQNWFSDYKQEMKLEVGLNN